MGCLFRALCLVLPPAFRAEREVFLGEDLRPASLLGLDARSEARTSARSVAEDGSQHNMSLRLGDADEDAGNGTRPGSIEYKALHERTEAFLKASRKYQAQVKGPLMDSTDVYLQQKARYEDYMHNLDQGQRQQHRLIHMLRRALRKHHTKKMEDLQKILDAKDLSEVKDIGPGSNDEDEDEDDDEEEEGSANPTETAKGQSEAKEGEPASEAGCKGRKKAEKGTAVWCNCNTNGEPIQSQDPCEDAGGGRNDVCQWSAEKSSCVPKAEK
mmetsp:Transcript_13451/g.31888  ORF Transcript_13451/g.31888 Transcript_13451/m.31888 type:complete len:270 (-) Transcript_13451:70-879(-)|eukprot:CAMPEP_0181455130 /NCGR_PEP_ID=MMETSP1110-20121109/30598_1 /TAXON_ID=174948 /ORGANISM="Symbiodinium sp., Strain CCMP421" /LENGTH=269 /DNA_ID=CAMNT_0023579503 /DNA_START=78 /DNA_END=887 /DNA_ORIENTATION=+